jgi:hypothetical protein
VTVGNGLSLLDSVVDASPAAGVGTAAQVQTLVDAANAVISGASNGTAPTAAQLAALGITGITADNLAAVQQAIAATTPHDGSAVNTQALLQGVATAAETAAASALITLSAAAQTDTANPITTTLTTYVAAGVTGVTTANIAEINSALNSAAITGAQASTTAQVQAIVNAYAAIQASADGVAANTTPALTAAQYSAIGVTGAGTSTNGLSLLDSVVDASPAAGIKWHSTNSRTTSGLRYHWGHR